ncbi:MAG: LacI family DNA-binding transcriptional regulator, partial [Armatimonadota bacterium]|nr:LacI family DNA-binding transcriptional regulator [Armatimonadota bacterium]
MATIREIARKAGVAVSTVSAILNDRPHCYASEATRERVRRAAEEVGYRPNRLARGLATGRTRILGLILQNVRYPTFAEAAMGVEDEAAELGYGVLLCNTHARPQRVLSQVQALTDSRVEGVVSVSPSVPEEVLPLLTHKPEGVPMVAINREVRHAQVTSILMRNREALRDVTRALVERGHRRILFLGGLDEEGPAAHLMRSSIDRREGYLDAMREAGLAPVVQKMAWESSWQLMEAARVHAGR